MTETEMLSFVRAVEAYVKAMETRVQALERCVRVQGEAIVGLNARLQLQEAGTALYEVENVSRRLN